MTSSSVRRALRITQYVSTSVFAADNSPELMLTEVEPMLMEELLTYSNMLD